jgi:LysM repeat protein
LFPVTFWNFGKNHMSANAYPPTAALPDQADPRYKYTVGPRDTLTTIALRFDVTVAWIKQVNHMFADFIFPGDELIIPPMPDSVIPVDPIDVDLYRGNERRHDIPGKLLVLSWDLRFEPRRVKKRPMTIDLGAHVHHRLMAHPLYFEDISAVDDLDALFLLAIVYLLDLSDKKSAHTIYFAGQRSDLDRYGALIERVAREAQKQRGITVPTLSDIPLPPREAPLRCAASDQCADAGRRAARWSESVGRDVGDRPHPRDAAESRPVRRVGARVQALGGWLQLPDAVPEDGGVPIRGAARAERRQ